MESSNLQEQPPCSYASLSWNAEGNPRSRALTDANPLIQDLAYHHHWPPTTDHAQTTHPHHHITITTDITSPSTMEPYINDHKDVNDKLLYAPSRGGNFSQIYPTVNLSNLNHPSNSTSFHMTHSLDLSTSDFTHHLPFHTHSFPLHHMHRSSSTNPSLFTDGTAEAKRPCTSMETKASQSQTAFKKSRSESRPSCPPFKVRKEKLGDRIAALQQLVAPFGKTDTASVLMEAIGYINFLQSQVETLSVPYMKSSQNHTNRVMQGGSGIGEANGEAKQDLRSRGLCLVPLSCMSYIAGDGGTEVWQQPNFGGAT